MSWVLCCNILALQRIDMHVATTGLGTKAIVHLCVTLARL